jgi:hypothetical protein
MSKKMGRPTLKPKDRRSKRVSLRLTPAEYRQIVEEARADGLTVTAYLLRLWKESKR